MRNVLLSVAVLGVLLPLVQSEQDGPRGLWWLFPLAGTRADAHGRCGGRRTPTGQRIGTAVLAGILRVTVAAGHRDHPGALGVALLCSVGFVLIALALGIVELRARQIRRSADQLQKVTMAAPSE